MRIFSREDILQMRDRIWTHYKIDIGGNSRITADRTFEIPGSVITFRPLVSDFNRNQFCMCKECMFTVVKRCYVMIGSTIFEADLCLAHSSQYDGKKIVIFPWR